MSVGTCWAWERIGRVKLLLRCGVLGSARRFGAHRGKKGAGTCFNSFFSFFFLLFLLSTVEFKMQNSDYLYNGKILDSLSSAVNSDFLSDLKSKYNTDNEFKKLCGRPPQYAPAPCKLTFDLLTFN